MDAAPQFIYRLNAPGLNVGWEGKIVLYFMKTLVVNGLIAWLIVQCDQYFHRHDVFRKLYAFRDRLKHTLAFSDYISEVIEVLLQYADVLGNHVSMSKNDISTTAPPAAQAQLSLSIPSRNILHFLNTPPGRGHRLSGHGPFPAPREKASWCVQCPKDGGSGEYKGMQRNYGYERCYETLSWSVRATLCRNRELRSQGATVAHPAHLAKEIVLMKVSEIWRLFITPMRAPNPCSAATTNGIRIVEILPDVRPDTSVFLEMVLDVQIGLFGPHCHCTGY